MIWFVLEHQEAASGKVFNVSTGAWSKREIAERTETVYVGTISEDSSRSDPDKSNFELDCTRIMKIGWKPRFNLAYALRGLHTCLNSMDHKCSGSGESPPISMAITIKKKCPMELPACLMRRPMRSACCDWCASALSLLSFSLMRNTMCIKKFRIQISIVGPIY